MPGVAMDVDAITIKKAEVPIYLVQLCQDSRLLPY
jgi:hypothetical protein